ncbi:MAG: hypothetical protein KBT32_02520 [Bacteroidales bacterium]|nr:hypothetical protein [Candidatus Physcocola equi]
MGLNYNVVLASNIHCKSRCRKFNVNPCPAFKCSHSSVNFSSASKSSYPIVNIGSAFKGSHPIVNIGSAFKGYHPIVNTNYFIILSIAALATVENAIIAITGKKNFVFIMLKF